MVQTLEKTKISTPSQPKKLAPIKHSWGSKLIVSFRLLLNEWTWRVRMKAFSWLLKKWRVKSWHNGKYSSEFSYGTILEGVAKDGFFRYPGYYSPEDLASIKSMCNKITDEANEQWKDAPEEINNYYFARMPGSIRIRHLEEKYPFFHRNFTHDMLPLLIGGIFHGRPIWPSIMYQVTHDGTFEHPISQSKAAERFGGQYHHDQWHHQIKAVVLLSDVGPQNGPLTFLKGSSKIHWGNLGKYIVKYKKLKKDGADVVDTVDDEYIEKIRGDYSLVEATGKKGDIFFFDTRTLHYAGELKEGNRKVIWFYF